MNGLSLRELCCLFCCPPWPSRIAAKLAFLPPDPTYNFQADETGSKFSLTLTERAEWQYSERYGVSTGKPSEKNLYADIDAAWHALRTRYGISPENIILYGQSIGTVPTVDLASRYEVGAVILHSPLMSGMRVAFPNTKRTWLFDAFPSYITLAPIPKGVAKGRPPPTALRAPLVVNVCVRCDIYTCASK
ncbi:unnamed protein product [Timema podura]|uniref:Alpha/beta hydrolase n=1 Tax=Timema podura TaxID=61482 RepID=A0ABN7PBQ2_TIMPD|nr:unnamed protein product [Timema podura]